MKSPKIEMLRACAVSKFGKAYNEETFKKALEKLKRWMRAAYGKLDWEEIEYGTLDAFYVETLKKPDGKETFNRDKS